MTSPNNYIEEQIDLPRWSGDDYVGTRYDDYHVVLIRVRDSDLLEQSNFDAALRKVGGERPPNVVIAHSSHWIYGWVDQLLIHKDDTDAMEKGRDVIASLRKYPILDEDDYDRRKAEQRENYRNDILANPELWDYSGIIANYGDLDAYLDTLHY